MSAKKVIRDKLDRAGIKKICKRHGVLALYLFGSRAEGFSHAHSDIDLGVVFPRGKDLSDTLKLYRDLYFDFCDLFKTDKMDIVFLQRAGVLIADNALRGILLYSADDKARLEFEDYILMQALDFRPWIHQYDKEMMEALREEKSID